MSDLSSAQFEVSHAARRQAEQDTDIGPVGATVVGIADNRMAAKALMGSISIGFAAT